MAPREPFNTSRVQMQTYSVSSSVKTSQHNAILVLLSDKPLEETSQFHSRRGSLTKHSKHFLLLYVFRIKISPFFLGWQKLLKWASYLSIYEPTNDTGSSLLGLLIKKCFNRIVFTVRNVPTHHRSNALPKNLFLHFRNSSVRLKFLHKISHVKTVVRCLRWFRYRLSKYKSKTTLFSVYSLVSSNFVYLYVSCIRGTELQTKNFSCFYSLFPRKRMEKQYFIWLRWFTNKLNANFVRNF